LLLAFVERSLDGKSKRLLALRFYVVHVSVRDGKTVCGRQPREQEVR